MTEATIQQGRASGTRGTAAPELPGEPPYLLAFGSGFAVFLLYAITLAPTRGP